MISSTNRNRVSRRRGVARWLPAILALVALGVVCSVLGVYVLAPMMSPGASSPEIAQAATAPPPNAPVVSYPSGQNQVTIVEKPVKHEAPETPAEPENGMTTTIEAAEGESAATETRSRGREDRQRQKPGDGSPQAKSGSETGTAEAPRAAPAAGQTPAAGDPGIVIEPSTPTETTRPTPASAATPAERPSAEGGSLFRVQVGRFADESDAHALAEELKRDGLTPSVVRTGPEGKGLYRVQVGTYRQRENADKALEALRRKQLEPYLAEDEPSGTHE